MRTRSLVISATLIAALVLALAVIALAQNPNIGNWKMNPAKSKFSQRPPKSFTMTIEAQGDSLKFVQDMIDADGKGIHRSFTAKYDGKDYPVTAPDQDAISLIIGINANTTNYVGKKSGKEVWRGQAVVSKDGKTSIDTGGGKDASERAFTYSFFLEKQ
jgi:hypothetical protein